MAKRISTTLSGQTLVTAITPGAGYQVRIHRIESIATAGTVVAAGKQSLTATNIVGDNATGVVTWSGGENNHAELSFWLYWDNLGLESFDLVGQVGTAVLVTANHNTSAALAGCLTVDYSLVKVAGQ